MQAGKKRNRITIQVNVPTQDSGYGTEVASWGTYNGAARIAAEVQDVLPSKSESAAEGVRIGSRSARVRIGYRAGITSAMRILIHGASDRTCRIVAGPAIIGNREAVEFMVEEFSTQGEGA